MIVYGLDFTSAPRKKKPITCAKCLFGNGLLQVEEFQHLPTFDEFEGFLQTKGPWIAGLDFPFGQPRKLIENLGWSSSWEEYVKLIGDMTKDEFVHILTQYRNSRPKGDKQHTRAIDKKADSRSPMMLYGVPVGKMFFEGSPRLLKSGASIIPNRPTDSVRIIVEAYPALVARTCIGKTSYKNDTRSKQTEEQREARISIVEGICSDKLATKYGFHIQLDDRYKKQSIEDPGADLLDAILCAIQAAWAYGNEGQNYGIPENSDPMEGWIVDPAMKNTSSLFYRSEDDDHNIRR